MRAGHAAGVEPEVVRARLAERHLVVATPALPDEDCYAADDVTVESASLVVGAPTGRPVVRRDQALLLRFLLDAPDGGDRLGRCEQGQRLSDSLLPVARPLQTRGNHLRAALLTLILMKVTLG